MSIFCIACVAIIASFGLILFFTMKFIGGKRKLKDLENPMKIPFEKKCPFLEVINSAACGTASDKKQKEAQEIVPIRNENFYQLVRGNENTQIPQYQSVGIADCQLYKKCKDGVEESEMKIDDFLIAIRKDNQSLKQSQSYIEIYPQKMRQNVKQTHFSESFGDNLMGTIRQSNDSTIVKSYLEIPKELSSFGQQSSVSPNYICQSDFRFPATYSCSFPNIMLETIPNNPTNDDYRIPRVSIKSIRRTQSELSIESDNPFLLEILQATDRRHNSVHFYYDYSVERDFSGTRTSKDDLHCPTKEQSESLNFNTSKPNDKCKRRIETIEPEDFTFKKSNSKVKVVNYDCKDLSNYQVESKLNCFDYKYSNDPFGLSEEAENMDYYSKDSSIHNGNSEDTDNICSFSQQQAHLHRFFEDPANIRCFFDDNLLLNDPFDVFCSESDENLSNPFIVNCNVP